MATALARLGAKYPDGTVAVFSHADAIKAILLHYLPMPLDHINRLEIFPASISVVRLHAWGPVITAVNIALEL